jgi:hypothetical protein
MKKTLTLFIFIFSLINLFGQEIIITPLSSNPELVKQFEAGEIHLPSEKSSITLNLPFIDDFSRNHQPGSEKQYWEDNFVFINNTFGVNPPTIGVATFEGLSFDGYPYDFENPDATGIADYLTSCNINLHENEDGVPYQLSDSIIFSFYYQPKGNGFAPRSQDSLVLEFYDADNESWIRQWGAAGPSNGTVAPDFKVVYISILESRYLKNNFRFRFRNRGRLSGNLDHWQVDFVWLDENRTSGSITFQDVGYQFPVNNLLNNYTSIPYKHYKTTSSIHMADNVVASLRNNQTSAVNLSNVKMRNYSEGELVHESGIPGAINFPAESSNDYDIPMDNYVYDPNIDEPFVSFNNEFVMSSGDFDLIPDNDTINFTQYFENYYAYDDGTAEAGIGLIDQGFLAVKYEALQADSLIGLKIYFNPIYQDPIYHFIMYIWDSENSSGEEIPGSVIYVNQTPTFAKFVPEGYDIFSYYFFDEPVYVTGTYFAGVWQSPPPSGNGVFSLNIGLDRNIENIQNSFYKTGFQWLHFPEGTLMLRPVFQSEMDDIIMGISTPELPQFIVYPNPANDRIFIKNINNEQLEIRLMSIDGRVILKENIINDIDLNVSDIPSGMYLIRAIGKDGLSKVEKILVSH